MLPMCLIAVATWMDPVRPGARRGGAVGRPGLPLLGAVSGGVIIHLEVQVGMLEF